MRIDDVTAARLLRLSQKLNEARDVESVLRGLLAEAVELSGAAGGLVWAGHSDVLALDAGAWHRLAPAAGERSLTALAKRQWPGAHLVEVAVPARYDELDARLALFRQEPGPFDGPDEARLAALAEVATPALEHAYAYRRLERMSRRLVDAQEAERRRLASELHDSAGQMLTALKLGLSLLQRRQESSSPDAPLFDEAVAIVDAVHEEIRAISQALHPPHLATVGLHRSLRGLSRDFARQSGLRIDYDGAEMPPLEERAGTALYRMLQEALANVAEHAQAEHVVVQLAAGDGVVTLSVRDDGAGMDARHEGGGLAGLRERFELIGGEMEIGPAPGGGTLIVGRVPNRKV